jgi:hypothetical protein
MIIETIDTSSKSFQTKNNDDDSSSSGFDLKSAISDLYEYHTFHYDDDIDNQPLHYFDFIGLEDFFIKSNLGTKQDYLEGIFNITRIRNDEDRKPPAIVNKRENDYDALNINKNKYIGHNDDNDGGDDDDDDIETADTDESDVDNTVETTATTSFSENKITILKRV